MMDDIFLTLLSHGCRVKGLPTKKKYSFRVLAENLAGPGKPSVETDPILIKDPIGTSHVNQGTRSAEVQSKTAVTMCFIF